MKTKKGNFIALRITDEQKAKIAAMAQGLNISESAVIRGMIDDFSIKQADIYKIYQTKIKSLDPDPPPF